MLPDHDLDDLLAGLVDQIAKQEARIADLERQEIGSGWIDYSAISTIVGWSSFTVKSIFYQTFGKLVWVTFYLSGESNSTSVTFTVPYTSKNDALNYISPIHVQDNNSVLTTPGRSVLPNNSNIVTCYINYASGSWTASKTKAAIGQFWYKAA